MESQHTTLNSKMTSSRRPTTHHERWVYSSRMLTHCRDDPIELLPHRLIRCPSSSRRSVFIDQIILVEDTLEVTKKFRRSRRQLTSDLITSATPVRGILTSSGTCAGYKPQSTKRKAVPLRNSIGGTFRK
ncbi:hypothetical protein BHM03_00025520 [Ensete ventricosum]|nr:hypothetical protein BHM03_00025520 [Ensete ventricosum]